MSNNNLMFFAAGNADTDPILEPCNLGIKF